METANDSPKYEVLFRGQWCLMNLQRHWIGGRGYVYEWTIRDTDSVLSQAGFGRFLDEGTIRRRQIVAERQLQTT